MKKFLSIATMASTVVMMAGLMFMPMAAQGYACGDFSGQYGTQGTGDGQFLHPDRVLYAGPPILFVSDSERRDIQEFANGSYLRTIASGVIAKDIAFDNIPTELYVLDGSTNPVSVKVFSVLGTLLRQWSDPTYAHINSPRAIAVDNNSHEVYIANDGGTAGLSVFSSTGTFLRQWAIGNPSDLSIDVAGNVWLKRFYPDDVQKFSSTGTLLATLPIPGVQFYYDDHLLIYATQTDNTVKLYNAQTGQFMYQWGSTGSGPGQFNGPNGISPLYDSAEVWVADTNNYRVQGFIDGNWCNSVTPPPSPSPTPTPTSTPPPGDNFDTIQNGKVKLNPGQNAVFRPPAVFNGGVEGSGDNIVTIEGSVQVDGSVKNIKDLHLIAGSTLNITGGLEIRGTLTIDAGATLIVGGKFTCPGATNITNNGSADIGNNQCVQLVAKGGGLGIGGILAVIGLSLLAGLGFGVFMKTRGK